MLRGGLAGENIKQVSDCYASTAVQGGSGSKSLGGLVGYNWSMSGGTTTTKGTTYYTWEGLVKNCYAVGLVSGDDKCQDLGALVGGRWNGVVTASFFQLGTEGSSLSNGLGLPLTDGQMRQQTSFSEWDFDVVWRIDEGKDYPRLRWEGTTCP